MIWMLRSEGDLRHIKDMDADPDLPPVSVCKNRTALDQKRTDYWAYMLFVPQLGFAKCAHCLQWEDSRQPKSGAGVR